MSEQEKIKLDIDEILQQLGIDKEKWRQLNQSPKVAVNRHPLLDTTKRTVKMNRKIII